MKNSFSVIAIILIVSLCCTGCLVSTLTFSPARSPEMLDWALNFDANDTLEFVPTGLQYAKDQIFVYGSFRAGAITARSFILTSKDKGKTWRETAIPVYGSEVLAICFPSDLDGFALVAGNTQGPGELYILKTTDGGQNWEKLPEIKKDHYSGWPTGFSFENPMKGALLLQYMDDNPENLRPVLVTEDGAETWKAYQSVPENLKEIRLPQEPFQTKGSKGASYVLSKSDQGVWVLSRKESGNSSLVFTFPKTVGITSVISVEEADCGCPSGNKKSRMLR